MTIRFLFVLFCFLSSFVDIQCAGSKRGRDEYTNLSLAERVLEVCGKFMNDLELIRKLNK